MDRLIAGSFSYRLSRFGGVLRSLLLFLCGSAGLIGAAMILEPRALVAVTHPPEPVSLAQRSRDEFARSMASIIADSVEVLAVHSHSTSGPAAIVVWMHDAEQPGVIDPREIAVISHNQLLRTITVYTMEGEGRSDSTAQGDQGEAERRASSPISAAGVRFSGPLDRLVVTAPAFCDRWRSAPNVQPRTIATGISDMRTDALGGNDNPLSVLRLWLRWSADSADGAGQANALIERR